VESGGTGTSDATQPNPARFGKAKPPSEATAPTLRPQRETLGRDFSLVWAGQGISAVGNAVTYLALPLVALLELHVAAWQVGVLSAINYGTYAVVAMPVGAWLDQRSRRPYVIAADAARMMALVSIPVAYAFGALTYTQLAVVAVVVGVFSAVFDVGYQSWFPHLVPRDALVRANGLMGTTDSIGSLAGPGVAGVLVAAVGAAYTLGIDGVSFAVAAGASLLVRGREPVTDRQLDRPPLRTQITEGMRWLWSTVILRQIMACSATANFFLAMWTAVETVFLVRILHTRASVIGAVLSAGAVGGIVGGLLVGRVARRLGTVKMLTGAIVACGAFGVVGPLASGPLGPWSVAVALFGLSLTLALYNAGAIGTRQQLAPTNLLSRATAANRVVTSGVMPFGALFGGTIATSATPRVALLVAALGFALGALWLVPILATSTSDPR
jgi:MFS family permease